MFVKDDGKTSQLKCDKGEIERLMQLLHESGAITKPPGRGGKHICR